VNAENNQLKSQLAQSNDALKQSAAFLVEDRLQGVPVAIVADKGVDPGATRALLTMLRAAGAISPGILWLQDSWKLSADKDLTALQNATSTTGTDAATRAAALGAFARRLAEPPATTRTRTKKPPDLIDTLRSSGFLDYTDGSSSGLSTFPNRAARVLVVTGTDSDLLASGTTTALAQALVAAHVPTVVAEVYDDHNQTPPVPVRGSALGPIRGDDALVKSVSTLDDGETLSGQTTAVLALEQIAGGVVGQYGYGQGARRPMPPPPS
jgi:hypothetical protein